ncbi:MAG: hypothetical protein KIT84_16385 [Labilithrix sp.]|nr:hypothetical protein [Labilithrix sp.]MCW5812608.1 hypothetical protein [Labilithrix sp.]
MLPILNLGPAGDEYLVQNVCEDLVDSLSVTAGVLARPRGETAQYTDPQRDVRSIGRAVDVDVVVDGSLRRQGELVRVTFRLIAVEDGFQLWAQRFERKPADVLTIADEAAATIAQALAAPAPARVPGSCFCFCSCSGGAGCSCGERLVVVDHVRAGGACAGAGSLPARSFPPASRVARRGARVGAAAR